MKMFFGVLALLSLIGASSYAGISDIGSGWLVTSVDVSTRIATPIPQSNLSGRYEVRIESTAGFGVAVGTSATVTYAVGGWIVDDSTQALSTLTLPLPSGTTIWGIAEPQASTGIVTFRVIEIK